MSVTTSVATYDTIRPMVRSDRIRLRAQVAARLKTISFVRAHCNTAKNGVSREQHPQQQQRDCHVCFEQRSMVRYDTGRWRLPECLCLVSRRPFFGMFNSVLAAGQALRLLQQAVHTCATVAGLAELSPCSDDDVSTVLLCCCGQALMRLQQAWGLSSHSSH